MAYTHLRAPGPPAFPVDRFRTVSKLLLLLLFAALVVPPTPVPAQDALRIAAIVNDDAITQLDVAVRTTIVIVSSQLRDSPETRTRLAPQVLRGLIDDRLKLQEARRLGITVDRSAVDARFEELARQNNMDRSQFEGVLRQSGILPENLLQQIEADTAWGQVVQRVLRPRVTISDDEIDEAIAEIEANRGKPEYRVSEIFLAVDDPATEGEVRQVAQRLADQLRQGADFAAVAQQFSQSATAAAGGDLGWVRSGQLEEALDQALAGMQENTIAGPIRSTGGYHLLYVRNVRTTEGPQGIVSLAQAFLPLPPDASQAEVAEAETLARQIAEQSKTCDELQMLGREANPDSQTALPNLSVGSLPPELTVIALDTPLGQATQPKRLETGIGVFMVCDRQVTGSLPSREEIADRIGRERLDLLARGYLRDLRRGAFIDIRV